VRKPGGQAFRACDGMSGRVPEQIDGWNVSYRQDE
jgi:hypothetical protein